MSKTIRPVGDRLVIKTELENAETASGIILPDNARKETNTAVVIDTGNMVKAVKEGDRVLYNVSAGTKYEIDGIPHKIITEGDCISILN